MSRLHVVRESVADQPRCCAGRALGSRERSFSLVFRPPRSNFIYRECGLFAFQMQQSALAHSMLFIEEKEVLQLYEQRTWPSWRRCPCGRVQFLSSSPETFDVFFPGKKAKIESKRTCVRRSGAVKTSGIVELANAPEEAWH